LRRYEDARVVAGHARPLRPRPEPTLPPKPPPPGPVEFGSCARCAPANIQACQIDDRIRGVRDRRLVLESRFQSGHLSLQEFRAAVEPVDGELRVLGDQRSAISARIRQVKAEIHATRICGGERGQTARALRKFEELFPDFLDEDRRALPWGGRPPAGSRLKPQPPPQAPTKTDLERAFVEKLVEKLL